MLDDDDHTIPPRYERTIPPSAEPIVHPCQRLGDTHWRVLTWLERAELAGRISSTEDQVLSETRATQEDIDRMRVEGLIRTPVGPQGRWVELGPYGRDWLDFGRMHTYLSSIAGNVPPDSEQAATMLVAARDGLRLGAPDAGR